MKLVLISGNPLKGTFGGVEEHTSHLLNALSSIDGIDIHFITYDGSTNLCENDNVTIHYLKRLFINKLFYPILMPYDCFQILRKIRKIHPDIVHFQGTHPLYSLTAVLCQRKYPTVLTVHGILSKELNFHPDLNPFVKYFSIFFEKFALKFLKYIIVVSPQIKEMISNTTKANILFIPNGVDLNLIKCNNLHPQNRQNCLLFIGNLVKLKGVANLVCAISFLKTEIPDIYLYIAGSGPQEDELKNLVNSYHLQDHIEFLGFVSGDVKNFYLNSADILVVPSLWESLPIVVLEGMACGKPIVASNVGGIPYLIHNADNGFLVQPGAIDELSEKIYVLLHDKSLRERMGKKNLLRIQEFSWDKISSATHTSYICIISGECIQK